VRKVTERKICNTHLLEAGELHLNARKKGKKGREREESDGKKDGQYAFLEAGKATLKDAGKRRKRIKGDGKKGGKRVRRVRK
jgi:hypothetical protein